jgi:hypothetical protein
MADDQAVNRAKLREELAELKKTALARLERRGYDVRGKTPAQIRRILKRRPIKRKVEGVSAGTESATPTGRAPE